MRMRHFYITVIPREKGAQIKQTIIARNSMKKILFYVCFPLLGPAIKFDLNTN